MTEKEQGGIGNYPLEQKFLDLGFQHLFPWIPLDSKRAIYIGCVDTHHTTYWSSQLDMEQQTGSK